MSMKDGLCSQHFPSKDGIIAAVKQRVTFASADFYECRMQTLVHYGRKCIPNGGDYDGKLCFVAENLFYQIYSLFSLYLLQFPCK